VLATTPFSFINIYLALKTSRNNAVVDLSESKNSEKRVIKEADFQNFSPFKFALWVKITNMPGGRFKTKCRKLKARSS
jgi:hypothetical protein